MVSFFCLRFLPSAFKIHDAWEATQLSFHSNQEKIIVRVQNQDFTNFCTSQEVFDTDQQVVLCLPLQGPARVYAGEDTGMRRAFKRDEVAK